MTDQAPPSSGTGARGGRPRREGIEEAALGAAARLIGERGYRETALGDIAAEARVAKTTLYRRWPGKAHLAVDALIATLGPTPEVGSALGDAIGWLARRVEDPRVRELLLGLIGEAARDDELRSLLRTRVRTPYVESLADATGVPPARVDLVFDLVVGTLVHRAAMGGRLEQAAIRDVTDAALALLAP